MFIIKLIQLFSHFVAVAILCCDIGDVSYAREKTVGTVFFSWLQGMLLRGNPVARGSTLFPEFSKMEFSVWVSRSLPRYPGIVQQQRRKVNAVQIFFFFLCVLFFYFFGFTVRYFNACRTVY
jgi:hypothetical protein